MVRAEVFAFVALLCLISPCARGQPPVLWTFSAETFSASQVRLTMLARIDSGWHLYSQHIRPGGPIPTKFTFAPSEDYVLSGPTRENGNRETHYDETYQMEVTWYRGVVTFEQTFFVRGAPARIHGNVTYMACNDELCMPGEQDFTIQIHFKP